MRGQKALVQHSFHRPKKLRHCGRFRPLTKLTQASQKATVWDIPKLIEFLT
jgi:hypothetical protein